MAAKDEYLNNLAREALATFEEIEASAKSKLDNINLSIPQNGLAAGNTFTSQAGEKLVNIHNENRKGYEALLNEPAIARVLAEDEDGKKKVYYISRNTSIPLAEGVQLASYHSPVGRLASLPLGDERQLSINGRDVTFSVLAKTTFKPSHKPEGWDSGPNVVQDESYGISTIDSLMQLLEAGLIDVSDELEALLAGGGPDNVSEGLKHQIRTAMGLRDQPILDQFQDEIFRLPLNSQLVILGPPGTGKTTTLIKRLGQKLDRVHLDEHEQRFAVDRNNGVHSASWIMFTPSDLLKCYVKEAFNREQVPASDERIKTWGNYRGDIARNVLGILKTSVGTGGKFVFKEGHQYLHADIVNDARDWYEKFITFHQGRIAKQLSDGLDFVKSACPQEKVALVSEIEKAVGDIDKRSLIGAYSSLHGIENRLDDAVKISKAVSDDLIKKERNFLYNNNKKVFEELAQYLSMLNTDDDSDDEDEIFDDEAEPVAHSSTDIQKAAKAYMQTIRSLARYKYLKRSINKGSKSGLIRDWLNERLPEDGVLEKIGQEIAFQNGLRRFIRASRRYVSDVPNSYREYRKLSLADADVFSQPPGSVYHIDLTELDVMILAMLRNARELLFQSFVVRNVDKPQFTTLSTIESLFKTQVLVDEATDFSVLQLACMESITSMDSQSLFACGDFNQRITGNGIRTLDQLRWVSPRLKDEKITTVYRQSKVLNEFSRLLIELQGGDVTSLGVLPDSSTHQGVQPVLSESKENIENTATWLAQRISEIEVMVQQFPSIAILVNREEEVGPMADALNQQLEETNLRAKACHEGQSLGQENDVRVFDVRYIKGLEFEAVFFVDVDLLAENMPDLFDRYLYVGATRAATYLGLTCHSVLPSSLESLRAQFVDKW